MNVIKEIYDFEDLCKMCWGGALDTLYYIQSNNATEELMDYLEELNEYFKMTETDLNDLLWFEFKNIFNYLGIPFNE